jgi:hypothetical protein
MSDDDQVTEQPVVRPRPGVEFAPKFICVGSQKAGTEWLYTQFAGHREFWGAPIKEISYFNKAYGAPRIAMARRKIRWMIRDHNKGISDFTHEISFLMRMLRGPSPQPDGPMHPYFALFQNRPGFGFDCTPGYGPNSARVVSHMMSEMPDTKFLLLVRDPADRLWSQRLMHERLKRTMDLAFEDHDLEGAKKFAEHRSIHKLSFVSDHIRTYAAHAGPDQFRVYTFDQLKHNADWLREEVATFVGTDPQGFEIEANYNRKAAQPGKRKMPDPIRLWAAEYFAKEYEDLAELVGGAAIEWRDKNSEILRTGVVT